MLSRVSQWNLISSFHILSGIKLFHRKLIINYQLYAQNISEGGVKSVSTHIEVLRLFPKHYYHNIYCMHQNWPNIAITNSFSYNRQPTSPNASVNGITYCQDSSPFLLTFLQLLRAVPNPRESHSSFYEIQPLFSVPIEIIPTNTQLLPSLHFHTN